MAQDSDAPGNYRLNLISDIFLRADNPKAVEAAPMAADARTHTRTDARFHLDLFCPQDRSVQVQTGVRVKLGLQRQKGSRR